MKRVLTLTGGETISERRYVLLQQGFLIGGLQVRDPKTTDVYRREVAILDAIDAIGHIDTAAPVPGVEEGKQLNAEGGELLASPAEYELLKKYVHAMPWGPAAARHVVDLHDWLEAAEKKE